ncbi:MAG: serine/threonine protein kinase, partial [Bdellovibrionales bacterium]|nr:serine/threonine protein kinase [Bdellovibrionales bacterium]
MAKVYLACEFQDFDPIEPRFVAVKHLQKKYSSQEGFVKCLVDEAKIASLLQHPNIVEVLDLGSVGTDFYLTMEWVNGKSLEKVFRALKQKKKFLSKSYLLYILREVAKGLHFAHEAKDSSGRPFDIVHCDISAQNILIGYDGSVLLSDFGIATAEKSQQEALAEVVLGKLSYMAPEQLSRKGFDRRADIYSFGVLLYEGLTYRKPFRMKNVHDLQQAIMKSQPDLSLPNIKSNPVLYDFIQRALSKNVDQRPSSILDFVNMTQDQDIARKEDIKSLMLALFEEEQKKETITRKLAIEQLTNQKEQELSALSLDDDDRDESLEGPREKTEIVSINPPNDVTRIALKKTDALGKVSLKQKPVLKAISNPVIVEQQTNSSSVALQTTNSHHSSASDLLQDGMDQLAESLQNETTDQQEKTELADFNFPEAQVEHTNQEDSWDKLRDAVKQELSQSKKQEPILTPDKPEKIHSTISDNKKLSKPKEKNIALESSGDEITLQIRITPSMLKNAIFFLFFVGIGFSLPYIFDTISKSQTSLLPVTQIQLFWSLEPYEKSLRVQHRYQDPDLIHDLYIK